MTTWIIVEDEPDVYEMLLAVSEIMGYDGIAFVDGDEAVDWIEDVDNGNFMGDKPELALLDIRLPTAIDGSAVGARLRKSPVLGNIVIVLMTAYRLSHDEKDQLMRESGADIFLQKPLPPLTELQRMFADAVAQRRGKKRRAARVK